MAQLKINSSGKLSHNNKELALETSVDDSVTLSKTDMANEYMLHDWKLIRRDYVDVRMNKYIDGANLISLFGEQQPIKIIVNYVGSTNGEAKILVTPFEGIAFVTSNFGWPANVGLTFISELTIRPNATNISTLQIDIVPVNSKIKEKMYIRVSSTASNRNLLEGLCSQIEITTNTNSGDPNQMEVLYYARKA